MMSGFAFTSPFLLLALFVLPLLWWLLRAIPPKPVEELFPPLKLLRKLKQKEEVPNKTPWWLLLLRLLIAAFVIIALAQPILRPQPLILNSENPLLIIVDNSWAAAANWRTKKETIKNIIEQAENTPIYIVATADATNQNWGPFDNKDAQTYLNQIEPRPLPTKRADVFQRLATELGGQTTQHSFNVIYFSDGIEGVEDIKAFEALNALSHQQALFYTNSIAPLAAIVKQENTSNALRVTTIRAPQQTSNDIILAAFDKNGLQLGDTTAHFNQGESQAVSDIILPLELRNDVARLSIIPTQNTANSFLIGTDNARKKVAILAPATSEMIQPLLSPLYYVTKALQINNETVTVSGQSLSENINDLINQNPSVIVLGDIANIQDESVNALNTFINQGGMVIRFAGPNLAGAENEDTLLPVKLRRGEFSLGGIMSWSEPQKIGVFPENSPFYGMSVPQSVTINNQILAEPRPDLFEKTWVTLSDGTPLVTAERRGEGWLIFIHTAPDPSWTNLPLDGFFETLLNRLVMQAGLKTPKQDDEQNKASAKDGVMLSPLSLLNAYGQLEPAPADAKSVLFKMNETPSSSLNSLPGLYGREGQTTALNLFLENQTIKPIQTPNGFNVMELEAGALNDINLSSFFMLLATMLFALDCFIILWMSRRLNAFLTRNKISVLAFLVIIPFALTVVSLTPAFAQRNEQQMSNEKQMIDAAGKTHLAFIMTHNSEIDDTSKAGLETLSAFIQQRTTINPGNVVGIDVEKDELSFYPLLYWPIDPNAPVPSQRAIEKVDAYMQHGGTVLFDTRDQLTSGLNLENKASPATQYLRDILKGLNIPPLKPAPTDHVVARSYYLMPDFPGRYRGSSLWVESLQNTPTTNQTSFGGDGVSPILITANDLAGGWAHDASGEWKYNLIPDDNRQRLWALRGGLNIVMYVLTGNYKADQLHAPAILKRLGQDDTRQDNIKQEDVR